MDKLFLQLSRTGDICGVLSIAHAASLRGEKVGIMACSEFSDILDGQSYAEKVSFIGKDWEIEKAYLEAKKICDNVVCTMVNGPIMEIAKYSYGFDLKTLKPGEQFWLGKTDSFCRESWRLAGCLKDWGKAPLVFDKRDKEREAEWIPKKVGRYDRKPIILLSAGSVSSPFLYKDLLVTLVNLKYGKTHNVIDLAEIKAHRFYDLLGLYEIAHCLITVDTGHLHLAAAVPSLPVMALIQDRYKLPLVPEMQRMANFWSGSAWRPQHHFFCRYRDFPRRCLEMFTAIENIGKKPDSNILQVYHGSVKANNGVRYFPIQPGSCRRDAVNVLNDKEHFPMLQDVIRMVMQVAKPDDRIVLTQTGTEFSFPDCRKNNEPNYAYRMNRDKNGNDHFFPACDLLAAPVDFWVSLFPELPDLCLDNTPYCWRYLQEMFKARGAKEISGIYRNE